MKILLMLLAGMMLVSCQKSDDKILVGPHRYDEITAERRAWEEMPGTTKYMVVDEYAKAHGIHFRVVAQDSKEAREVWIGRMGRKVGGWVFQAATGDSKRYDDDKTDRWEVCYPFKEDALFAGYQIIRDTPTKGPGADAAEAEVIRRERIRELPEGKIEGGIK